MDYEKQNKTRYLNDLGYDEIMLCINIENFRFLTQKKRFFIFELST